MKAANGEYIALSDQDDVWISDKISILVNGIGNCSLIYSDSQLIDQEGRELSLKMSNLKRQIPYNSPLMYTFGAWAPGHSMLFKKRFWRRHCHFPIGLHMIIYLDFRPLAITGLRTFPIL